MTTLTICALQTGEHRASPMISIVRQLANVVNGPALLLDGPGADYFNGYQNSFCRRHRGIFCGLGIDENIGIALEYIGKYLGAPLTINLIGFSRGAITCLAIANALQNRLTTHQRQSVCVNIIAIDPVAGLFLKYRPDVRLIPSIVKHYVAFLAMHERRILFKPQDASRMYVEDYHQTFVSFLPIPGVHSHGVYISDPNHSAIPLIVRHFIRTQLFLWGTRFEDDDWMEYSHLNATTILECFGIIRQQQHYYEALGDAQTFKWFGKKLKKERRILKHLEEYVLDSNFFFNQFHREIFKLVYPAIFNYCFEHHQISLSTYDKQDILDEFNRALTYSPYTYQSLISYFHQHAREAGIDLEMNVMRGKVTHIPPGGPWGNSKTESFSLLKPQKLDETEILAKRLIELAHVYRRERRHEFLKTKYSHYAKQLINQVCKLMSNRGQVGNLYHELVNTAAHVCDKLERHGSQSRLYQYLCIILKRTMKTGIRSWLCKLLYFIRDFFNIRTSRPIIKSMAINLQKNNRHEVSPFSSHRPPARYTQQYGEILTQSVLAQQTHQKTMLEKINHPNFGTFSFFKPMGGYTHSVTPTLKI